MRRVLRFLKNIWFFNFLRRIFVATTYFNKKYLDIIKWGFSSKEDTNFTYHLTEGNLMELAHIVSVVTDKSFAEIMGYMNEVQSDAYLQETIFNAYNNSDQKRFADKEVRFGRRVGWYAFVRALKPKLVIETGVDKGLGSVVLCAALLKNKEEGFDGKFYGTDINPKAGYFLQGKYKTVGQVLYGDSIESLSKISEKIDLFINDSDHSADYEAREYEVIKSLLSEKAIILGDNSHVTDKLAAFSFNMGRSFLLFKESPLNHWYPGGGIGISFIKNKV